jgi:hypothetical protein
MDAQMASRISRCSENVLGVVEAMRLRLGTRNTTQELRDGSVGRLRAFSIFSTHSWQLKFKGDLEYLKAY